MRKIYILLLALIFALPAFSQKSQSREKREDMRREMHEFKMKFIAQEIELQESQQKRFFEVYDRMWAERGKLSKATRGIEKRLREGNPSEQEYTEACRAMTEAKEKDAEIEKKYDAIFSEFLTSKQVYKMKDAEEKFRNKMHEMRHKRRFGNSRKK